MQKCFFCKNFSMSTNAISSCIYNRITYVRRACFVADNRIPPTETRILERRNSCPDYTLCTHYIILLLLSVWRANNKAKPSHQWMIAGVCGWEFTAKLIKLIIFQYIWVLFKDSLMVKVYCDGHTGSTTINWP